jgi:uncharacterized protein YggT (Ycf19 family)
MEILYQILYYAYILMSVFSTILFLWVILGWTPLVRTGFYALLDKIVSPYMNLFRGWIVIRNVDLTPMVGILLFEGLMAFIGSVL